MPEMTMTVDNKPKQQPIFTVLSSGASAAQVDKPAENGQGVKNRRHEGDDIEGGMGPRISVSAQVKECCRSTFTPRTFLDKFPIVKWLPKYRCDTFQADLIAGLTVGLTVIPQGLAYASIANLQPQYGLYSAFIGCFVYALMGTSKDITLGPTAIMSLMTATFATLPGNDPTLAIILTLVSGIVQLLLGILKLGILVNYISYPVINAFTSAAAITIAVGQLKHILGVTIHEREFLHVVYYTCKYIPDTSVWDLVMGLVCFVAVILLKKLRTIKWSGENDPDVEVPLALMILRKLLWLAGTGANAIIVIVSAGTVAIMESQGVNITDTLKVTGHIQAGLPPISAPKFEVDLQDPVTGNVTTMDAGAVFSKIGAGLGIVPLLGLVETMAIGKAFARQNNYKIDPTQELLAIGSANLISSFFHSFPITGSFSRTAVNSQSGVRTPMGGVWTGGLVILALCLLTQWFYYIPKAALAAVIIAAVIQMVDYHILVVLWRANKWDLVPLVITFVCSLAVGIEYGILIGIGLSLFMLLFPIARPKIKFTVSGGFLIVTPMQGLNFPAAEHLELQAMEKAQDAEKPRNIVLNMEHMSDLDYTAVQSLKTLSLDCLKHDMHLVLCNGQPRVLSLLRAAQMSDLNIVPTLKEVLGDFSTQDEASGMIEEDEAFRSHL